MSDSVKRAIRAGLVLALSLGCSGVALAQANEEASLVALRQLGERAQSIRVSIADGADVVVVPDEASYATAIESWTLKVRFPVLIDDGSPEARERIGRFVRAYKPARVIRWEAPEGEALGVRERYDRAMARSWEQTDMAVLLELWKTSNFSPLGAVVVSERDPSWVAGLALASGRGQVTIWTDVDPGRVGGVMQDAELEALDASLRSGLESCGWAWNRLGDAIEAVTLAMDLPTRYRERDEVMAVTDRIGRHGVGRRFAYTGMIFGTASESAYSAMCALFLLPESAWMFDGYDERFAPPYALRDAETLTRAVEWPTIALHPPANSPVSWRNSVRFGLNAGFVHVNTSGRFDRFDVNNGSLYGHDVPTLKVPAIVHFIHSFSAQRLNGDRNIAGRFIENGAYIYVGSVDEPYVTAFVPCDTLLRRLFTSMPMGGAARMESRTTVWKVNYFGDPLKVIGQPSPRSVDPVSLSGAVPLESDMQAAIRDRALDTAAGLLVMMGRDATAVQLAKAKAQQVATANKEEKGSAFIEPSLARAAFGAAQRAGETELVFDLAEALIRAGELTERDVDVLWQVIRPTLGSTERAAIVRALSERVRNASMVEDAEDLSPAVSRLLGRAAAKAMVDGLIPVARRDQDKEALRQLGRRYRAP